MRKPESIAYGLEDRPPHAVALFVGLQQMSFLGVYLVISPLFVYTTHLGIAEFHRLTAATLLVSGLGVMLQAARRFGIGAGYFCPLQVTSTSFVTLNMAIIAGGLETAFGMIAALGAAQIACGELFRRLRGIFSVELAGVAVALVGLGLGYNGVRLMAGVDPPAPLADHDIPIGVLSLSVMVACNVWSRGHLRLFSAFVGLAAGVAASIALDGIASADLDQWRRAAVFSLPKLPAFGWGFDPVLVAPFVVLGLAFSLHGFGALAAAQRFNDAEWRRPDMAQVCRGIRAEGVANLVAALVNGLPLTSSGGAVTLAAATGCTSRYIAYWLGGIMISLAFLPKMIALWFLIPVPVIGAAAVFLSAFTLLAGLQMIASRMLDGRKIITVGISLILGISHEPLRHFFQEELPNALVPVTQSGVALGVVAATILSALFRIGANTRLRRVFVLGESQLKDVVEFLEQQGRAWGARPDTVHRAEYAMWQALEILHDHGFVARDGEGKGEIEVETVFDEFTFSVIARYRGDSIPLSTQPPSHEELLDEDTGVVRMAGYLLHRLADRVRSRELADGMVELRLTFTD
ncbi:MAG TPA: solute carrier family 23 protein [Methylococcus sp.]|nr:solute carrier family 23 protein [Methylococcus sp.]